MQWLRLPKPDVFGLLAMAMRLWLLRMTRLLVLKLSKIHTRQQSHEQAGRGATKCELVDAT